MINRFSNLINHNRSAAKISQVLCSSVNVKNDAMTFCFTWHHYQNDETNHSLEFWASWNCKFLFSSARRFCGAPTLTLLTSEARVDEIVVPAAKIVWIFNAWVFWIGNHLCWCPWWGWHLRNSFLLDKLVLVWKYSTMHSHQACNCCKRGKAPFLSKTNLDVWILEF